MILAATGELAHEHGLPMDRLRQVRKLVAQILAIPHLQFQEKLAKLTTMLRNSGVFVDIKSAIDPKAIPGNLGYWSL